MLGVLFFCPIKKKIQIRTAAEWVIFSYIVFLQNIYPQIYYCICCGSNLFLEGSLSIKNKFLGHIMQRIL